MDVREIDLETRQRLLNRRDKRNAYQRAYQRKRIAALTPEEKKRLNAYHKERQKAWRNKIKTEGKPVKPSLIESLLKADEKRKAYGKQRREKEKATLTPEELEKRRKYAKEYYARNKDKKRASLTPEALEKRRKYAREYYARKKAQIISNTKKRTHEKDLVPFQQKSFVQRPPNKVGFIDSIIACYRN